jgi:chromosome segregation ATPase
MTESVETKLARIEEKMDMMLRRLESGDANFKELEKRISTLERQFYAAALVGSLLWAVFVIWFRGQVGG